MPRRMRLWIFSTCIALLAAGLAILLRASLTPLWGSRFVFTFSFPAVVIAAWYGRLNAGLICTAILTIAGAYYVSDTGSFSVRGMDDLLALSLFAVFGVVIASIVERLHAEIARSKSLAGQARAADAERKSVLESIQDGFFVLDRNAVFTYGNAQAERLLAAEPDGLTGHSLWTLYPDLVGTPLEAVIRRVGCTGAAEQLEQFYPPVGRWLQVRVYPAGAGGVSVLFQDITEQKRTADRLRESSSMLEAIVEGTEDFIYAKDPQGRFTLANRALTRLLGRDEGEIIGRSVYDLIPDVANADAIAAHDRRVMELGRAETVEETVATRSGVAVYLTTKSPRFDEHGRVIGLIGIATDITGRKRVESELRDAHDSLAQEVIERTTELVELSHHLMQVTETEKARLAAELHDALGGSLTTLVLGLARLKNRSEPLDQQKTAAFAQVESTLQEIIAMTRRIIGDLRPVTLDTLGLAPTLRDHVEKWSRKTGIEARLSLPPTLPPCRPEVALTVFRIVQEALTNVAKHAYASLVQIVVTDQGDRLEVTIEDNGVGIARGTRRAGSHGVLGMRERAAGCGGVLTIDSGSSGRGTCIALRVPAAFAEELRHTADG